MIDERGRYCVSENMATCCGKDSDRRGGARCTGGDAARKGHGRAVRGASTTDLRGSATRLSLFDEKSENMVVFFEGACCVRLMCLESCRECEEKPGFSMLIPGTCISLPQLLVRVRSFYASFDVLVLQANKSV